MSVLVIFCSNNYNQLVNQQNAISFVSHSASNTLICIYRMFYCKIDTQQFLSEVYSCDVDCVILSQAKTVLFPFFSGGKVLFYLHVCLCCCYFFSGFGIYECILSIDVDIQIVSSHEFSMFDDSILCICVPRPIQRELVII